MPGGESRNDVRDAGDGGGQRHSQTDRSETVGILSHTTAIKILLADLIPGYNPLDVDLDNTSVTTIRRKDDASGNWSPSMT